MRVSSRLTTSGPIRTPIGPSNTIPPSTEKRINNGGIFIFLPTIIGLKKLSIIPTNITDQIKSPIAGIRWPVAKRKIIAGTVINAVPKVGNREAIPAVTPQRVGFGTPKTIKPIDTKIPWIRAIKRYPFAISFIDWESLVNILLSSLSEIGLSRIKASCHLVPSFKK